MNTTAETANARLDQARTTHRNALNDLVTAASSQAHTTYLYSNLCSVARAEAAIDFYTRLATVLEKGKTVTEAALVLSAQLARGADDQWSGRGNDIKRAYHDYFRTLVASLVEEARFAKMAVEDARNGR